MRNWLTLALALTVALLLSLAAAAPSLAAGTEGTGDPGDTERVKSLNEHLAGTEGTDLFPEIVDPAFLDEAGRAAQRDAVRSYYEYRTTGFDHRARVFEWQLLSSKVIFVIVLALVTIGIYFSWLQFRAGLVPQAAAAPAPDGAAKDAAGGAAEKAPADKAPAPGADTRTTISLSGKGIEVTSPVLGVIILTISLAFLYLYLVYVYPIEDTF